MVLGAAFATWRRSGAPVTAGTQHLAAGVVFAAAAGDLLPDLQQAHSPGVVLIGGLPGVAVMLIVKRLGSRAEGPGGLIAVTAVGIFIDGLVLGIGFVAAARTGLLLTIALTLEILFLGVTVALALALGQGETSRWRAPPGDMRPVPGDHSPAAAHLAPVHLAARQRTRADADQRPDHLPPAVGDAAAEQAADRAADSRRVPRSGPALLLRPHQPRGS